MFKLTLLLLFTATQLVRGMYIRGTTSNQPSSADSAIAESDWEMYKRKLGLSNQKVELLKQQKDQKATVEMINRFLKENQNLKHSSSKAAKYGPRTEALLKLYHFLLTNLKISKSTLKTSLNFVLGDSSKKVLKRPRRKIALNMVSDMPAEEIDDLIKVFAAKHGIDSHDQDSDADDYNEDPSAPLPSSEDKDYLYENLYEDEEDLAVPAKSHLNSEYGSFQDLILQASRSQWQREVEETKLRSKNKDQFI